MELSYFKAYCVLCMWILLFIFEIIKVMKIKMKNTSNLPYCFWWIILKSELFCLLINSLVSVSGVGKRLNGEFNLIFISIRMKWVLQMPTTIRKKEKRKILKIKFLLFNKIKRLIQKTEQISFHILMSVYKKTKSNWKNQRSFMQVDYFWNIVVISVFTIRSDAKLLFCLSYKSINHFNLI